jgi:preprotein translocase subunit YajC
MHSWQELLAWAGQTAPATQQPPNFLPLIIGAIVVMFLFQFLISRPQQKAAERKRQEAINALGKGDQVITTSGIHGSVDSVDKEKGIINLTIAPKTVVRFSINAVATYSKKDKNSSEDAASA